MDDKMRDVAFFALTGAITGWVLSWVVGSFIWDLYNGILGALAAAYVFSQIKFDLGIKNPLHNQIATAALGAFVANVLALVLHKIVS